MERGPTPELFTTSMRGTTARLPSKPREARTQQRRSKRGLLGGQTGPVTPSTGLRPTASILGRKYPVAPGLQADDLAGLEFPVPGGVDLDHGLALAARER